MVDNLLHHSKGRIVNAYVHPMLAGSAAVVDAIGSRINQLTSNGAAGTLAFTAFAGIAIAVAVFYTTRGRRKSPWSRRKRKQILSPEQWRTMFTQDGRLHDNGSKFLKKVRSGGVDPSIRAEVWPFLLGVYDLTSTKEERDAITTQKREEYEKLRSRCHQLLRQNTELFSMMKTDEPKKRDSGSLPVGTESPDNENAGSKELLGSEEGLESKETDQPTSLVVDEDSSSKKIRDPSVSSNSDSSDSDSSNDPEVSESLNFTENTEDTDFHQSLIEDSSPSNMEAQSEVRNFEDFTTWQRIIRLDAIRANGEWIEYSPAQAVVSDDKAKRAAEAVGLKDYDHLDSGRIFHAARLVAILDAYALYDQEIGYCQGMSDLLSPIICVITEDHLAFWCFVGFMKRARHNFRLDEVGIRRQLNTVSKIIKCKDSHLYRHLEQLQAEDCFFVYRMVVVLFRRELTFEQTLCLWEVMWADQAAIRARIGKAAWSMIRQQAPPTEDLLLYAIAASVLQRRKLIIEKYNSIDEILRECNAMAGQLDVWKLLDDASGLVMRLHNKVETPL